MKVYCFYLVKTHIDVKEFIGVNKESIVSMENKDVSLYAFTPDKKSREYFKETRNMDLFFEKVINIEREDYNNFCEENKEYLLEYHTCVTKEIFDNEYRETMAYLLCTTTESDFILYYKEELVLKEISNILTDDILNILENIRFKKKIKKSLNNVFLLSELITKIEPLEDINYDVLIIDELSLFIKLFSNTLKK